MEQIDNTLQQLGRSKQTANLEPLRSPSNSAVGLPNASLLAGPFGKSTTAGAHRWGSEYCCRGMNQELEDDEVRMVNADFGETDQQQ